MSQLLDLLQSVSDMANDSLANKTFISSTSSFQDLQKPSSPGYNKIVGDQLFQYFETFVNFWILFCLSMFGMLTNAFNFLVFTRQGFKEGVNVSLVSIACWDFIKCFAGFIHRLYGPISLLTANLATTWKNATSPYIDYVPIFSGYVSYALATYVSVERCLCVTRPFTVKSIFTPKFTLIMVVCISVFVFGSYFVMFFIYEIVYVYSHSLNSTIAIYTYNSFYYGNQKVVMVYYKCAAILIPTSSFVMLCISSAITMYTLQNSTKFLRTGDSIIATKKINSGVPQREKKVAKMLLAVIMVNIGNLFPRVVFYIGQLVEPEFYVLRKYNNFFLATAKCLYCLDFTNASVHFFIFLKMSSNFNATFYNILGSRNKII